MKRVFLITLILLIAFSSNYWKLNDEYIITEELRSISNGNFSININEIITYQGMPFFIYNGKAYPSFSHSLPILATPLYLFLSFIEGFYYPTYLILSIFNIGLVILTADYISGNRSKIEKIILISAVLLLISANLLFYTPQFMVEDWLPYYSLQLTNILLLSFASVLFYATIKRYVNEDLAFISVFIFIFATPVAYWGMTAKHHALSLFLISFQLYLLSKWSDKKDNSIYLTFFIAGLLIWVRPLDGIASLIALYFTLILLSFRDKKTNFVNFRKIMGISIIFLLLGYSPAAIIGWKIYGLPIPVEIFNNLYAQKYAKISGIADLIASIPLSLFLKWKSTFGLFTYSPVFILPVARYLKEMYGDEKLFTSPLHQIINLRSPFELFLIALSVSTFIIYLPIVKSGVVDTGVRDYRFLLLIYFGLTYWVSKSLGEIDFNKVKINLIILYPLISIMLFILTGIFKTTLNAYISIIYLIVSSVLGISLFFYERFDMDAKSDVLSFAIVLPSIFLIFDNLMGYFSPYDIHFILPILDRFFQFILSTFS